MSKTAGHQVPKHITDTIHPHAKEELAKHTKQLEALEKLLMTIKQKDKDNTEAFLKRIEELRKQNKEYFETWQKHYKTAQGYMKKATSKDPKVVAKYEQFTHDYYCKHPELRVCVQPVQVTLSPED